MRIRVDPAKCEGHGRCYALAPELFEVDDYGLSTVRGDGTVPKELKSRARLAIDNCPEYAVEELPTPQPGFARYESRSTIIAMP